MKLFNPVALIRPLVLSTAVILLGSALAGCCCTIPVSLITRVTEDKQGAIKNPLATEDQQPTVQAPDQQATEPTQLPNEANDQFPDVEEPEEPTVDSCTWHGLTYSVGSEYSTEFNDGYAYHAKAEANITVEYYAYNESYTEPLEYLEDHVQQMTAMGNTCQIYENNGVSYALVHWWYGQHEIRAFYMMDGYVLTIHGRTTEYSEEIPALIDYVTSGQAG